MRRSWLRGDDRLRSADDTVGQQRGWTGADAKELAAAAEAGDAVALAAFRRGTAAMASMIASTAAVCDLDLVVIGGGVAKAGEVLFGPLREALTLAGLSFIRDLRVVPADLGGDAGLVGAPPCSTPPPERFGRAHPR